MNIGDKIKELRRQKRLTQKELAQKLGTSPQNLAQYENGKRRPKYETIKKIATALDVTISDLIEEDDLGYYKIDIRKDLICFTKEWEESYKATAKELPQMTHAALEKSYYTAEAEFNNDFRSIFLLGFFSQLNSDGKDEAVKRVSELTEIPRYQKGQSDAVDPDNPDTKKE